MGVTQEQLSYESAYKKNTKDVLCGSRTFITSTLGPGQHTHTHTHTPDAATFTGGKMSRTYKALNPYYTCFCSPMNPTTK